MPFTLTQAELVENRKGQKCRECDYTHEHWHWVVGDLVSAGFSYADRGIYLLRAEAVAGIEMVVSEPVLQRHCELLHERLQHRRHEQWKDSILPNTDYAIFKNCVKELEAHGLRVSISPAPCTWSKRRQSAAA